MLLHNLHFVCSNCTWAEHGRRRRQSWGKFLTSRWRQWRL